MHEPGSDMPPYLISIEAASAALGVSRAFFYKNVLGPGYVTKVSLGRRALVVVASLRSYVDTLVEDADDRRSDCGWPPGKRTLQ